jgi:hypothetical protein
MKLILRAAHRHVNDEGTATDNTSCEITRGRRWPIGLSPARSTPEPSFSIHRSSLEAAAIQAYYDGGAVAIGLTHKHQLARLQQTFGHLWSGNIERWDCLPDAVGFPQVNQLIGLSETYDFAASNGMTPVCHANTKQASRPASSSAFCTCQSTREENAKRRTSSKARWYTMIKSRLRGVLIHV